MSKTLVAEQTDRTSEQLIEDIYRICYDIIEEKRWHAFKDTKINSVKTTIPLGAFITLHDRRIHLNINHDFKPSLEFMLSAEDIKISEQDAIKSTVYHLLVHEYNHHNYCPRSPELFKDIISSIADVISKKEYRKERVKALSFEVHNMFSDTVIDTIAAHGDQQYMKYRVGKDLYNLLVLNYNARHTGFMGFKRFDKALQLFLESNLYLSDTNQEMYTKMKRYLPRFFEGRKPLESIISVFIQNPVLEKRIFEKKISDFDSLQIYDEMSNYKLWSSKAEKYTEIIYPFLKQEHDWLKNAFSGKGQQYSGSMNEDESGQQSREQKNNNKKQEGRGEEKEKSSNEEKGKKGGEEKKKQQGGSGKEEGKEEKNNQQSSNGTSDGGGKEKDEQGKADKGKQEFNDAGEDAEKSLEGYVIDEDMKDFRSPKDKFDDFIKIYIRSKRKSVPDYLSNLIELDQLYNERAGKLNLFADENVPTEKFRVFRGKEPISNFNVRNIDWPSTRFIEKLDGSTDLKLYQRELPLEIDAAVHQDIGGIPDLCFVFDSSSSMGFDPLAGTGEYHTAVLTFYSIVNGLEKKGIAPLLNYNVINFSNITFSSGWCSYKELMKVKEVLFRYQNGLTALNVQELKKIREHRKDNYILFLLSDLGLNNQENFEELEKELIDTHESRAAHVLIFKLGGDDMLSKSFERKGISVIYPRNINDFMYESIKFTKDVYAGGEL